MTVVKAAGLAAFGERWATDAGYASLILDYRGFGDSDGEPRNLVSLEKQYADYLAVIRWARTQPELFRADKIVVAGSALSALYVAQFVVEEPGIAGGIAHSPTLDGESHKLLSYRIHDLLCVAYAALMAQPTNPRLLFWASVDWLRSKLGLSPIFIKSIGRPDEFAFLNSPSSYPGAFISSGKPSILLI